MQNKYLTMIRNSCGAEEIPEGSTPPFKDWYTFILQQTLGSLAAAFAVYIIVRT